MELARFSLIVSLLMASEVFANGGFGSPINSMRGSVLYDKTNEVFISAAYPVNHSTFQMGLKRLWDHASETMPRDNSNQPWRKTNIQALQAVVGYMPRSVYLLYPVMRKEKDKNNIPQNVFDHYEIVKRKVKQYALFKWGCDDSIIPVLGVGQWPEGTPQYLSPVALTSPFDLGEAKISSLEADLIPPRMLQGLGASFRGVTISWPDKNVKAAYIYYIEAGTGGGYEVLIVHGSHAMNFGYLKSEGPMDGLC